MRKIKIYLPVLILLVTIFSCEDNREEHLDQYDTVLYFLNSGEHDVTLYKIGENSVIPVKVYKAGYNTSATPTVEMEILDENFLKAYNLENGTAYKMFPDAYYKPVVSEITFTGDQMCESFEIEFETELIHEKMDLEDRDYVLPLHLVSTDTVNSKMNYILLRPFVAIPIINLSRTGVIYQTVTDAIGPGSFSLDIEVPFTNIWELKCSIGLDTDLLTDFNKESLVAYKWLEQGYSISNLQDDVVVVQPGESSKTVEVTFDSSQPYGNYVFPFHLTDVSKEGVMIDEEKNTCVLAVTYTPPVSKLPWIDLNVNMISTNASQSGEGSLAEMIDNNGETYFHSRYSNDGITDDGLPHYIQIDLGESYSMFAFEYITRHNNNNGAPGEILISGSQDGKTFTDFGHITSGLPVDMRANYTSSVFIAPEPYRHFRFMVVGNKDKGNFFALAEFSLRGSK